MISDPITVAPDQKSATQQHNPDIGISGLRTRNNQSVFFFFFFFFFCFFFFVAYSFG